MLLSCLSVSDYECRRSSLKRWAMRILDLAVSIFAIIVAINCNPDHSIAYGILAALFPEIFLIQWGVRKYFIKEQGYCPRIA
jgi:hypothetical protein